VLIYKLLFKYRIAIILNFCLNTFKDGIFATCKNQVLIKEIPVSSGNAYENKDTKKK